MASQVPGGQAFFDKYLKSQSKTKVSKKRDNPFDALTPMVQNKRSKEATSGFHGLESASTIPRMDDDASIFDNVSEMNALNNVPILPLDLAKILPPPADKTKLQEDQKR